MDKERILGFDICTDSQDEILENIFKSYAKNEQLFIVNINPEIAVSYYKNDEIKAIFNKQKYQIPDGTGIVWASRKRNGEIRERITGIDFMKKICEKSCRYSSKIYLYGTTQGIVQKAKMELEKEYPTINIVGVINGYCSEEKAVEDIKQKKPDIVFVGLGSPKQEEFIIKYKNELEDVKIFMPVGGSFDVISKTKKRAPEWMQRYNIEWIYRFLQEPKRLLRQLKLLKFIYLVLMKNQH